MYIQANDQATNNKWLTVPSKSNSIDVNGRWLHSRLRSCSVHPITYHKYHIAVHSSINDQPKTQPIAIYLYHALDLIGGLIFFWRSMRFRRNSEKQNHHYCHWAQIWEISVADDGRVRWMIWLKTICWQPLIRRVTRPFSVTYSTIYTFYNLLISYNLMDLCVLLYNFRLVFFYFII